MALIGRKSRGERPCPLGRPALRSLTLGPSPLRGEGGPRDQRYRIRHCRLLFVPPLHEVERGPGGEASEGRTPQRARTLLALAGEGTAKNRAAPQGRPYKASIGFA